MNGPVRYVVGVWHQDANTRSQIIALLREQNFDVAGEGVDGLSLVRWATKATPDLIIAGQELDGLAGVNALLKIASERSVPAILISPAESLAIVEKMLADHVMSFLCEPIRAAEIVPNAYLVLRRFSQMQHLKNELNTVRNSLSDTKICFLAKFELMRCENISEPEAHQRLQRMATDNRIKLVDAARRVLQIRDSAHVQSCVGKQTTSLTSSKQ